MRQRNIRSRAAGFTLIELLVVISIIGILVTLVSVAVFKALQYAERSAISMEVGKLHSAMEDFKNWTGADAYPPDGTGGMDRLKTYAKIAFPGVKTSGQGGQLPTDLADQQSGPGKALVYWLSELNKDKRKPFRREGGNMGGSPKDTKQIFYTFDESRIRNGMYFPKNYDPNKDPPYVYFENSTYDRASFKFGSQPQPFKPYNKGQVSNQSGRSSGGGQQMDWFSPDTFQIIAGGTDKLLGTGGTLNLETSSSGGGSSTFISKDDEDNFGNFEPNKMIGDIR